MCCHKKKSPWLSVLYVYEYIRWLLLWPNGLTLTIDNDMLFSRLFFIFINSAMPEKKKCN